MPHGATREVFERLARDGAVIERLVSDSRRAGAGAAFFAWPGERTDGRAHIADAVARGASAVVWDPQGGFDWDRGWRVPNAPVLKIDLTCFTLNRPRFSALFSVT